MARPRGGDWLADLMDGLRAAGVTTLVSALTPGEEMELELRDEAAAAHRAGLEFVAFPIPDRSVPRVAVARPVLQRLAESVSAGGYLVAHCRAGIGRSALIAAGVLVLEGADPAAVWDLIESSRGCPVPDTDEQRQWVNELL
ncbi:hypothetical protein [Nocardia sp. NPDC050175]|uniref:protein-tyrosine phosphatase family protein n=1 Tax=Nocardia sp. NPDC050175 TaxID=3364317 RepID=UPI0037BC22E5